MTLDWSDLRTRELHERLARLAQEEFEMSLTASARVADAEHLGSRIAATILGASLGVAFGDDRTWLSFPEAGPEALEAAAGRGPIRRETT